MIEASRRIANKIDFTGVAFAHQLTARVGSCIDDLELIAKTLDTEDIINRIEYIPYAEKYR